MSGHPFRSTLVQLHRYAGLLMAGFLILEGLTGSILAFETPLSRALAPWSFATPRPGAAMLSPGVLAERLEQTEPKVRVGYFPIQDDQAVFAVQPRTDPATGRPYAVSFNHVILDPWTGRELARLRYGDLTEGPVNFVPFIYEVHQNLAVGPWGTILLGVVALLWTIDCILAVYLTFPPAFGRFMARWATSWRFKWPASGFRFTFDLHRGGSLWAWPILFVFAWSSVMFTLPEQVYEPVTGALFAYRSEAATFEQMGRRPQSSTPKLTWTQADAAGARLMADAARAHEFRIERPYGIAYIPGWNVYTYAVVAKGAVQARSWATSLWLDGDSGRLVELDLPREQPVGNQVDEWLRALHFGDLQDSLLYRSFVCLLGVFITALSLTGVLIWLRKRAARRSRRRASGAPARKPVAPHSFEGRSPSSRKAPPSSRPSPKSRDD